MTELLLEFWWIFFSFLVGVGLGCVIFAIVGGGYLLVRLLWV